MNSTLSRLEGVAKRLADTQETLLEKQAQIAVGVPYAIVSLVVSVAQVVWGGVELVGAVLAGTLFYPFTSKGTVKRLAWNGAVCQVTLGIASFGLSVLNIFSLGLFIYLLEKHCGDNASKAKRNS